MGGERGRRRGEELRAASAAELDVVVARERLQQSVDVEGEDVDVVEHGDGEQWRQRRRRRGFVYRNRSEGCESEAQLRAVKELLSARPVTMSLLPRGFVRSDDATESTRRARLLPFLAAAEATVAIFSAVCLWVFVWDATEALLADTALNRLLLAVCLCGLLWLRSLYNAEELARAVDDESPRRCAGRRRGRRRCARRRRLRRRATRRRGSRCASARHRPTRRPRRRSPPPARRRRQRGHLPRRRRARRRSPPRGRRSRRSNAARRRRRLPGAAPPLL